MATINIGDGNLDAQAAPEFVCVYIYPGGAGTNVAVNAGDTLSYYTNPSDQQAQGTITAGNNQTFTTGPLYLASAGVSNVTLSGPGY